LGSFKFKKEVRLWATVALAIYIKLRIWHVPPDPTDPRPQPKAAAPTATCALRVAHCFSFLTITSSRQQIMSRRATPGQAAQNQQTIKSLLKLEPNKVCADCKRNKR
jgi:hypothetical protein